MRSRKYLMNYNQSIPNSTRFSDINGWLANLSGVWKVTDLLSAIRQISNSPDIDDIKQIGKIHVYADQSNLIDIDCLYALLEGTPGGGDIWPGSYQFPWAGPFVHGSPLTYKSPPV